MTHWNEAEFKAMLARIRELKGLAAKGDLVAARKLAKAKAALS